MLRSSERVDSKQPEDNYVFQRSLRAYIEAEKYIYGDVLELGCGEGYHIETIAANCNKYIAIDKFQSRRFHCSLSKVEFIKMKIPPLKYIPFSSYDTVLCFQVIEHIKNDIGFLQEIYRVLKPGGLLVISTPNAGTTITRNPWHVREYRPVELKALLYKVFSHVEIFGIKGNDIVTGYYNENLKAVRKLAKIDFLKIHKKIPSVIYRPVFDLLNRINRIFFLGNNRYVSSINHSDFSVCREEDPLSLDIFCLVRKNNL